MKNKLNSNNYDFSIQTFKGGFDKNFSYILTCLSTGSEIIIDASGVLENTLKSRKIIKNKFAKKIIFTNSPKNIDFIMVLGVVVFM